MGGADGTEDENGQEGPRGARRGAPWPLALVVFLLVAAWPVRTALLDPAGHRLLAADTVTSQLPWSAWLAERGLEPTVRNDQLSDQGLVFHPTYRWVVRSWLAGDPPLWNPLTYLGAPALGNPQAGVLDPQVLALVGLEGLLGEVGFGLGLALLAWLRLGLGGFGAYLLARRLGLVGAAPWLAGFGFGLSAFTVLWLNHPLGHVPAFLPWSLLAVEGVLAARRAGRSGVPALVGLFVATLASVLAGHPETSFYCCALVGLWCLAALADDVRGGLSALAALVLGGLASGPMLVPFVEYLRLSFAYDVRRGEQPSLAEVDGPAALAAAACVGAWLATRRAASGRRLLVRGTALVLAVAVFVRRGLPEGAGLAFAPGLFGRPGEELGYLGPGSYLEEASLFAPLVLFALALAAALSGGGPLRRRGLVLATAAAAFWLAQRAPGLLELKRLAPVVGLGATVRMAPVAALGVALLAGEGWQSADRRARLAGLATLLAVATLCAWPRGSGAEPAGAVDPAAGGGLARAVVTPDVRGGARRLDLEGWVDPARVGRVALAFVPHDADGAPLPDGVQWASADLFDRPSPAARSAPGAADAPDVARWFRTPYLDTARLGPGWWTIELALLPAVGAEPVGRHAVARVLVQRPWRLSAATGLGLLVALLAPFLPARLAAALVAAVALRQLAFAEGQNPAVPLERVFPLTRTEQVLLEAPPGSRFFGGPGVLPPNSGMVRGLSSLRGYDGMEPVGYARLVDLLLPPGTHRLLGWNARGVDPDAPLFRLTGVERLVTEEPLATRGWELLAGPGAGAPRAAECYVYGRREPLPRAFVASRVVSFDELRELVASGADFDPLEVVGLTADWRPQRPCTSATVREVERSNNLLEFEVELDGDGLLVVTEQWFPGWVAEVDGTERAVEIAQGVLRGVPLAEGDRRVRLVYRPASLRAGLWLAAVALGGMVLVVLAARRRAAPR